MTIAQKYKKWSSLDLRKVAMDTLMQNEDLYINAQKEQMRKGENKLGGNMNSYKWQEYAERKQGMNSLPPYGVRDNYLTGAFYKGMGIEQVSATSFDIGSTDSKNDIIEQQSGGDIWGLNRTSSNSIKGEFTTLVVKNIKDATE